MQIDIEDVLGGTLGRICRLFLYLLSAIWTGSMIGAIAWAVGSGHFLHGFSALDLTEILSTPVLLLSVWIVPNVAFLAVAVTYLMVSDNQGYAPWGIIMGMESLFVVLGQQGSFHSSLLWMAAWTLWLVLLAMAETGIWLLKQAKTNRWAREMAALNAENALRRAEREAAASREPGLTRDDASLL